MPKNTKTNSIAINKKPKLYLMLNICDKLEYNMKKKLLPLPYKNAIKKLFQEKIKKTKADKIALKKNKKYYKWLKKEEKMSHEVIIWNRKRNDSFYRIYNLLNYQTSKIYEILKDANVEVNQAFELEFQKLDILTDKLEFNLQYQ